MKQKKKKNVRRMGQIFLNALEARGNKDLNVVYLSSGWDSTSILAGLAHIYGKKKVVALTSRATHSKRAGTHNIYEVERAKKIAKAIGIQHHIVDTDFSKKFKKVFC